MIQGIRNIAIFAHVDAGKTSITEQILFYGGRIKKTGSVDEGTTHTDFLPVEKARGISVRSAHSSVDWKGIKINLADTPGHVDFSADVERVMRIIDGAVLVISAVEGLQAHTLSLWSALQKSKIPVLIFVNKIDRIGSEIEAVVSEMKREWKISPLCFQELVNEGTPQVELHNRWTPESQPDDFTEAIVSGSEAMLEQYLDGKQLHFTNLEKQMTEMIAKCSLYPLMCGSAKLSLGISDLLDAIIHYLPPPIGSAENPLSALVFGMEFDKVMGKVAHVRIFDGSINNREMIRNSSQETYDKVVQIRKMIGFKYEETQRAIAGEIVGVCGLNSVAIGDTLGLNNSEIPSPVHMQMPLLTVQVRAVQDKDFTLLVAALQQLNNEDPSLQFEWLRDEGELNISVMGWIQMEVLEQILMDRYGIEAKFENPTVIYYETPISEAEGFIRYWMPKPCWAILKFRIEPGFPGSGIVYESLVGVDKIARKYQNEVERTISQSLKQGLKGWEVTDVRITLIDGEDHEIHTRPGDFIIATPMGVMNGLVNCGTTLLEPLISFKIRASEDLLGAITSDITKMRGTFESPNIEDGKFILQGILPVATSQDYSVKLSSRSGGNASIVSRFAGFQPCSDELGVVRSYKGISPLDEAKWILKARGAMQ